MATSTHAAESTTLSRPIHPGTRIGHVHLKVADLGRALSFYCGVLGFELMQRSSTPQSCTPPEPRSPTRCAV